MIYQTAISLAILASASATLYVSDHAQQKHMWETFKTEYNRKYSTMDEETERFGHFLEFLKTADLRNEMERRVGGTAIHGITKFADMSQSEFTSKILTADISKKSPIDQRENLMTNLKAPDADAALVDWTGIYTTPIKNQVFFFSIQVFISQSKFPVININNMQGYCGGCWAFSATEQIESDGMRTLHTDYILSPEQPIQCDKTSEGCNGGWTEHAYNYIKNAGGQETESAYPYSSYSGTTGSCHSNSADYVVKLKSYTTITGSSASQIESNMASYVQSTGPLSVCLDASTWSSYTSGIMTSCGNTVDHCVQAVGVYAASTGRYWKVRNQWGTSWGESGFIQLAYGQNTCDITNDPTWT